MKLQTGLKWVIFATSILMLTIAMVIQPGVAPTRAGRAHVAADPQRLRQHVRHLSIDLFPRSREQPLALELAAIYIQSEFEAACGRVSSQVRIVDGVRYRNVIAKFGPEHGETTVVGSHYDTVWRETPMKDQQIPFHREAHTPGADDNASGVAGLLELARLLGEHPQLHPIELVAYVLEEPPYFRTDNMGSAWHAQLMIEEKRNVKVMISLEMIGYFSDQFGSQRYPLPGLDWLYPDRGNFIALVGRFGDFGIIRHMKAVISGASSLPVFSINAPPLLQGIDFSDHLNYWRVGIPAVMITDTAFLRNAAYHLPTDTIDRLDFLRMSQVVQGVFEYTQEAR